MINALLTLVLLGTPQASGQEAPLHVFEVPKPVVAAPTAPHRAGAGAPPVLPKAHDSLTLRLGAGYVQGADWGTDVSASGAFAGAQLQFSTLLTGARGRASVEQGSFLIHHPSDGWRFEAGDLFSHLRGAGLGGRFSWRARGGRRPSLAILAPRFSLQPQRKTVISYRDQLVIGAQTILDTEVASDRSYLVRSHFVLPRLALETAFRSQPEPLPRREASIAASAYLWRRLSFTASGFRSTHSGDRSYWSSLSVRFPLAPGIDLTLERGYAGSGTGEQTTMAAMGSVRSGPFRFFHRQQYGEYAFVRTGLDGVVERQQTQSMSTYNAGSRVQLTLQLATQRADSGQLQHWEELQTTVRLTRTTTVRAVTSVPDIRNHDRFQAYIQQALPGRFAVQADFGRVSAFRSVLRTHDRSRFKLMVFKTVDVATPARGGDVTGRVVDLTGHAVPGVRVRLGSYAIDTDKAGTYRFRHVPPGEYELSVDLAHLPAHLAWGGRVERLTVRAGKAIGADLTLAPLDAIHGRVYADRNGNGRFDPDEGVAGAVLEADGRFTATDAKGEYSFFNLWPGSYVVKLHKLPSAVAAIRTERAVEVSDAGPATAVDFVVRSRTKEVIWEGSAR